LCFTFGGCPKKARACRAERRPAASARGRAPGAKSWPCELLGARGRQSRVRDLCPPRVAHPPASMNSRCSTIRSSEILRALRRRPAAPLNLVTQAGVSATTTAALVRSAAIRSRCCFESEDPTICPDQTRNTQCFERTVLLVQDPLLGCPTCRGLLAARSTAELMAPKRTNAAVVARYTPACRHEFMAQPAPPQARRISEDESWKQREFIEAGGWATPRGTRSRTRDWRPRARELARPRLSARRPPRAERLVVARPAGPRLLRGSPRT